MDTNLTLIKTTVYDKMKLVISSFTVELESKEYYACRFSLNGQNIISRNAKITPKKKGQFVTFWKRNKKGITAALNENDLFDFFIVNVRKENKIGQFVLPKSVLISKGIITTNKKEGKRGFRVYPSWDTPSNKKAKKTQEWQLDHFYEIKENLDLNTVSDLYNKG